MRQFYKISFKHQNMPDIENVYFSLNDLVQFTYITESENRNIGIETCNPSLTLVIRGVEKEIVVCGEQAELIFKDLKNSFKILPKTRPTISNF